MSASERTVISEERLREGLTMALYISLVLAAEFVTLEGHIESESFALSVIWGTAVGLTIAHVFAFDLSARIFSPRGSAAEARDIMASQVLAAACVATVLSLPFAVLGLSAAIDFDQYLIVGFLGFTGWGVAHTAGRTGVQALVIGLIMSGLGAAIVLLKATLSAH